MSKDRIISPIATNDTTKCVISEQSSGETQNTFPYMVFGVPVLLAFFVTVLKYYLFERPTLREVTHFFYDLCVDTLVVGSTVLIAYHYIITPSNVFWISVFLLFITLLCLFIRRRNINGMLTGNIKWISLIVTISLTTAVMSFLFFKVC